MLQVQRHPDARAFLARAEPWLLEAEIVHAGVLQSARQAQARDPHQEPPMYWATVEDDGAIIGCAYRTPPYKVGITALPTAAIAPLAADLADVYTTVSGFSGPEPTVSELAAAWVERHGGSWSFAANTRQHLLSLAATPPPDDRPGMLRLASRADTALAQSWGAAASLDSGIAAFDGALCVRLLGAKQLYFWAEDAPRCMLGVLRETPRSAAIGIIYTPAAYRGKGHATAAVANLNQLWQERRVPNRFLYIDPTNGAAMALSAKLRCTLVQDAVDIDWQ